MKTRFCVDGCGRSWQVGPHDGGRRWHPECQGQNAARRASYKARHDNRGCGDGSRSGLDTRERPKVCWACANLPERRPPEGCPPKSYSKKGRLLTCGMPRGESHD